MDEESLILSKKYTKEAFNPLISQLAAILNRTSITTAHQFADNTARDAYFSTNPTELVDDVFISVGSGYQQYIAGVWVPKTAVVSSLVDVMSEEDQVWEV